MVETTKTIRGPLPRLPFEEIARDVLGAKYELSLVICGDTLAQRINMEYRKKSYRPNVLSFPLASDEGEMFLNIRKAEREARSLGVSVRERVALLYVHGLWHLKGFDHGTKMEKHEEATLTKFGL